jgi:hypothetical protein
VRAFVRYNSRNDYGWLEHLDPPLKDEVEIFRGDLANPEAVANAIRDRDTIFHLGALIRSRTRTSTPVSSSRRTSWDAERPGSLPPRTCSPARTQRRRVRCTAPRASPDRRAASVECPVSLCGHQDRSRSARAQLLAFLRNAGRRRSAVQHLRSAQVSTRSHSHVDHSGSGTRGSSSSGRRIRRETSSTSRISRAGSPAVRRPTASRAR